MTLCFAPFSTTEYKYACANPNCDSNICLECLESLITFSEQSNLLPTCPNSNCNAIYIMSSLKKESATIIKIYQLACLNYFMKEQSDNILKGIQQKKIIDRIRDERLKFIEQTFPKSIILVANLTFKYMIENLINKNKQ